MPQFTASDPFIRSQFKVLTEAEYHILMELKRQEECTTWPARLHALRGGEATAPRKEGSPCPTKEVCPGAKWDPVGPCGTQWDPPIWRRLAPRRAPRWGLCAAECAGRTRSARPTRPPSWRRGLWEPAAQRSALRRRRATGAMRHRSEFQALSNAGSPQIMNPQSRGFQARPKPDPNPANEPCRASRAAAGGNPPAAGGNTKAEASAPRAFEPQPHLWE